MPEFCTCGAQLPPDARFCHKCGKPQFEAPVESADAPAAALPAAVPPPVFPLEVNFHNPVAVRTGFLAALLASLVISLPMPLGLVWMILGLTGGGFFSVWLYARRTGAALSVRSGARMGWMTGVFSFVLSVVLFTVNVIVISRNIGLPEFFRDQLNAQWGSRPEFQQVLDILQSPAGLGAMLLFSLFFLFLMSTILTTVGGALCAKVLEKE